MFERLRRRGTVRHPHRQHVLRPKRLGSQIAGERRVDPAGKADYGALPSDARDFLTEEAWGIL
jgi:hypothetical protein